MDGFHNREHAFGEGLITAGAVCMLKLAYKLKSASLRVMYF